MIQIPRFKLVELINVDPDHQHSVTSILNSNYIVYLNKYTVFWYIIAALQIQLTSPTNHVSSEHFTKGTAE